MQTYNDLYNSVYSEKDLKYVTNPFNQDDGFVQDIQQGLQGSVRSVN